MIPWHAFAFPLFSGYKNHTDCLVNHGEKRDRFATILVYLRDVEEGGETKFPQLGISVKPQMGLALIWNSMNSKGECDPTSIHNAAKVVKGHKFIIQRWWEFVINCWQQQIHEHKFSTCGGEVAPARFVYLGNQMISSAICNK